MLDSRKGTLTTDRLVEAAGELFATKGFDVFPGDALAASARRYNCNLHN